MPEISPESAERLFIAFDYDSIHQPEPSRLREEVRSTGVGIKVGTQIACMNGWLEPISTVIEGGNEVFADMKLHDIGNTEISTARPVLAYRPSYLNVHATSSTAGLEALVAERDERQKDLANIIRRTRLLGVTVLTDIEQEESFRDYRRGRNTQVLYLADKSMDAGLEGIVCSPDDLKLLTKYARFDQLVKMVPAIRPAWSVPNDQKNYMTPTEAIERGGENVRLVVGRPITAQYEKVGKTPIDAVLAVTDEISAALAA